MLSRENMSFLKAAGVIVYIERELDEILRADALVRPLFTSRERVSKMYYERERLYKGYADFLIKNDTPPEITAERLISMLEESRKG